MDNARRRNIHARAACGGAGRDPSPRRRRETGLYGAAGTGAPPTSGRTGKNLRRGSANCAKTDAVSTAPRRLPSSAAGSRRNSARPRLPRRLVMAGNETTTNLIGNGMLALLRHPGELQRLREDPGLIPPAVEELLRYDAPAQALFRRALANCEVNGFTLRKGDNIILLIGAASRNPDAFDGPDRLDVGRAECPHLILSRGIHYCLGAQFARLGARIAFETPLERFPEIGLLDDRPRFRGGVVLRGLRALPLRGRA